jgi:hypothetical protein
MEGFMDKYAYSYNGENYRGAYATREEAFQSALRHMGGLLVLPSTIYVGKIEPANPHARGLSRLVAKEMAARARSDSGGAGGDFLAQLTPQQLSELDQQLELSILGWLQKNQLMPTFFSVDAISEHAVPPVPHTSESGRTDEVKDLGPELPGAMPKEIQTN